YQKAEMADRDQILLDFQGITGIENYEECIAVLEQNDWDLMAGVNSVMSHLGSQSLPSDDNINPSTVPLSPDLHIGGVSLQPEPFQIPSPASGSELGAMYGVNLPQSGLFHGLYSDSGASRMLTFTVEHRDKNIPVVLPDSETVGSIKVILESETGVPAANQELRGWVNKNDAPPQDTTLLRDLHLPKENILFLLSPGIPLSTSCGASSSHSDETDIIDRLTKNFTLKITFKDKNETYSLQFPGTKTIREVKCDVYSLIDVPVRNQVWTGWPETDDEMTLAGSRITYPSHCLEVSNRDNARPQYSAAEVLNSIEMVSDDSDTQDQEDMCMPSDEEIFNNDNGHSSSSRSVRDPLIPPGCLDEVTALESFNSVFASRYGDPHPLFYMGDLDSAIKDALMCSARNRKLLAVYLHHDSSILANVFCSQVLCAESIVDYLSTNFICWAWDLTDDTNRAHLLGMVTKHFGTIAASTVRDFKIDQLPVLLIITRTNSRYEVFTAVRGSSMLDEVMTSLMNAVEVFSTQQEGEIAEEAERDAREQIKRDQDEAYQMSLAADRSKAESKREEEEIEKQKELEDRIQRDAEDRRAREEEMEKQAIQKSLADMLPDEPPTDCKEPVSMLRLRCPKGETIVRRFLASTALHVLLKFIVTKGFHLEDYKVLTTYPRRDLTTLDENMSLHDHKLFPQETLILEER
ncbi:unnamed protein product, partial [Owenia fusiformis]